MWSSFKELIFVFLQQIAGVVGDWGLAIIVLTVFVRLLLMPLTLKQTKSMYELQRIQPKIKELQKKYSDDKEKLQEETLKHYQENNVNPFGGCLPMLLQMPLLFALYAVLGGTAQRPGLLMKHFETTGDIGKFFFLIPDIAKSPSMVYKADGVLAVLPYVILVVLFGLSVWLPQALMPGEKQQKMIGMYMGVMMLFFGWSAPAGVLLYWDTSSIWQVVQQQIMMARLKRDTSDDSSPAIGPGQPDLEAKPSAPAKKRAKKKRK